MNRIALSLFLIVVLVLPAASLSIEDFERLEYPGNSVLQKGDAVHVTGTGYYPQGATGVLYRKPVNMKNLEFEVSIDRVTGSADNWYAFSLLNKKAYFDINDATKGEGLVVLMRPTRTGSSFTVEPCILSLETNGFFEKRSSFPGMVLPALGTKFKISMKKSGKGFELTINGLRIADNLEWLNGLFTDETAWLSFSACDIQKKRMRFTLYSVN